MNSIRPLLLTLLTLVWTATQAAAIPGRAEVKKVVGTASVIKATGGAPQALTQGAVLVTGDTITTGPGSMVDLWLGINGDALRVEADSTLKLDNLEIISISERTVNTGLSLGKGQITGNVVNKLTLASKYEIKTTAGVAGIRGTIYSLRNDGTLVVAKGIVMFTFVINGNAQTVRVEAGNQFKPGDAAPTPAPAQVLATVLVSAQMLIENTGTATTIEGKITVTENPLDVSVAAP